MKRKKIIVGRIGFIAIGLFLLSLYLKETFQYAFFNREQQQLFLFDSDYVSGLLLQPGGVALCLSRFLVQFFYSTVWSVSLTALLLLSIILASMGILRKLGGKWFLAPLAFCPAGTLILSLFDPCFFYEGLIAYAMAMVGLYLYLSTARETLRMRLCLGGAIAFILLGWQERLPLCSHVVPFAVIWLERAKKVFVRCLMFHLHCYWLGELCAAA